jgi:hypothetical protein
MEYGVRGQVSILVLVVFGNTVLRTARGRCRNAGDFALRRYQTAAERPTHGENAMDRSSAKLIECEADRVRGRANGVFGSVIDPVTGEHSVEHEWILTRVASAVANTQDGKD